MAEISRAAYRRLLGPTTGDRIRLADRWDPDTGGMGRDAEITQVTWTQATDTAQLTTDSPNDRLEVVLTRLAAIQSARPANY